MVEPSAVWVKLDVRWGWWTFAVDQVKWVATEGISGVEDATWVIWFPSGDAVEMVLPSLVSVEWFWFAHVKN